jgi:hypothetical protein
MKKNSIYNGTVNKHGCCPNLIRRPLLKEILEKILKLTLLSYYNQDGVHSAVRSGIGSEKLSDNFKYGSGCSSE